MKTMDLHTHTMYSHDSTETLENMSLTAIKSGIDILAFTDHCDIGYTVMKQGGEHEYLDIEAERNPDFEKTKKQFEGRIKLLKGIEVGQPHRFPQIAHDVLDSRKFDIVLGSLHFLKNDRDVMKLNYNSLSFADSVFEEYFSDMIDMLKFGGFDTVAHMDYPVRAMSNIFDAPSIKRYESIVTPVLKTAADLGKGIEINMKGIWEWQKTVGPEIWVLEKFRKCGGEYITIGSDAHIAERIGSGFRDAVGFAKQAGFDSITYFEERKPVKIKID